MYDIVIIGAGPAGLTAALYAGRAEKSVLVLEKENFGGQITFSPKVENYPSCPGVSGNELAEKLLDQALENGADVESARVLEVNVTSDGYETVTDEGTFTSRTVIIAAGSKHRRLGLAREEELTGEGVSYCAVCDGAFYAGKRVAVIGGGNTALQDAVLLADLCEKVTVVQNLSEMTGESKLVSKLRSRKNVEFLFNTVVTELVGNERLEAVKLFNSVNEEYMTLGVDGIFVAIGQQPENDIFSNLVDIDERGYIVSDENCLTRSRGVFVAGDCRTKSVRQITTANADGAVAALAACRYIDSV
ncbi:MAG: NAD(P)/FAD-dependent oxidoreductase [Eubacteriales bacterium]